MVNFKLIASVKLLLNYHLLGSTNPKDLILGLKYQDHKRMLQWMENYLYH